MAPLLLTCCFTDKFSSTKNTQIAKQLELSQNQKTVSRQGLLTLVQMTSEPNQMTSILLTFNCGRQDAHH